MTTSLEKQKNTAVSIYLSSIFIELITDTGRLGNLCKCLSKNLKEMLSG